MDEKIVAEYTGAGASYLSGIPARDLTETDWEELTAEQQQACVDSGLYQFMVAAQEAAPTKVEDNVNE